MQIRSVSFNQEKKSEFNLKKYGNKLHYVLFRVEQGIETSNCIFQNITQTMTLLPSWLFECLNDDYFGNGV